MSKLKQVQLYNVKYAFHTFHNKFTIVFNKSCLCLELLGLIMSEDL